MKIQQMDDEEILCEMVVVLLQETRFEYYSCRPNTVYIFCRAAEHSISEQNKNHKENIRSQTYHSTACIISTSIHGDENTNMSIQFVRNNLVRNILSRDRTERYRAEVIYDFIIRNSVLLMYNLQFQGWISE